MNWHELDSKSVLKITGSSITGLSSDQVKEKLAFHGNNTLSGSATKSIWRMVVGQLNDVMIIILIIVAIISGFIGEVWDTIIIILIVIINAVIGFIQEYRTERAMEALRYLEVPKSHVIRNGEHQFVSSAELVPGDVILLEEGTLIPADLRLSETHLLLIEEAALTGESMPANKFSHRILQKDVPVADRNNMAYRGTKITSGRGRGIVIATGMNTEIGKIAGLLQEKEPPTPLQVRMKQFGKTLSYLIAGICLLLFVVGVLRGEQPLNMLLISISLAVAAIPEALPSVITLSLTIGAKKLVKKNVLIRKLSAVETLGSVSFICTDKTGTLTQNKMSVASLERSGGTQPTSNVSILEIAMCLNQNVHFSNAGKITGDPTEVAIVEHLIKINGHEYLEETMKTYPRSGELPFDSKRKRMTTVHKFNNTWLVISKGAPESIADCITDRQQANILAAQSTRLADDGMRVIAFAYKTIEVMPQILTYAIETDLNYCGLLALRDQPREEVKKAIRECKQAGIRVVMITGDHLKTAASIARHLEIVDDNDLIISGTELDKMIPLELDEKVERIKIYARVSPEQKLNIVKALQRKNHFVAMTGDGVNDAPALKTANIGIAMGINGTDVSKEASHMILLDDNFTSIVNAVREGRRIFDNIRKFVRYIMTCNSAEIFIIFLAPLVGLPIPLLPVQILWINLITDGLPGLALATEKAEKNIMKLPPKKPNESMFSAGAARHIISIGLLMTLVTLSIQAWAIHTGNPNAQTMVFTVLSFSQFGHAIAASSNDQLIINKGLFSNRLMILAITVGITLQLLLLYTPQGNGLLSIQPLSVGDLVICVFASLVVFHAVEFQKLIYRRCSTQKNSLSKRF